MIGCRDCKEKSKNQGKQPCASYQIEQCKPSRDQRVRPECSRLPVSAVEMFRSSVSVFLYLLNVFLLLCICVNFHSFIWFFSTWNIYKDIVIVNKSYDIKWNYYVNLDFSSISPLFHRMLCSDLYSMFCLQFYIQMKVYNAMLKKKCSYYICGSKIFVFYVFFMQFIKHFHM